MSESPSFVLVDNVRVVNYKSFSTSVKGVFVGTNNYFFFIPVKTLVKTKKEGESDTFDYKGKAVISILNSRFENNITQKEVERFILKEVKKEIPKTRCIDLSKVEQVKIFGNLFVSGIMLNTTKESTGWEMFISKLRVAKKEVKTFYQAHPKLV